MLPLVVGAVVAVLSNQDHAVRRQVTTTQRKGISDGGIYGHVREALRPVAAEVVFSHLVHVQRNEVHGWAVVTAVPIIPLRKRSTMC